MSDFFGKLKKEVNKATSTVSAKSQHMMEVNKLKGEIATVGRGRKTTFEELGEKVYEMNKAGQVDLNQLNSYLIKLDELDAKKAELEAKMASANAEMEEKINALKEEPVQATEMDQMAEQVKTEVGLAAEEIKDGSKTVVSEIKQEVNESLHTAAEAIHNETKKEDGTISGEYKA